MPRRKKQTRLQKAKAFLSQHRFLVAAALVFTSLSLAATAPMPPVEEESLHASAPVTMDVSSTEVIYKDVKISTYGNWAFHRHTQDSFVELLDAEGAVVGSRQYFSLFDDAKSGAQSFVFENVKVDEAKVVRVQYFSYRGIVSTLFNLSENVLAEENPEINVLISNYKQGPRASWFDGAKQVHFIWPEGREDWPDFRL